VCRNDLPLAADGYHQETLTQPLGQSPLLAKVPMLRDWQESMIQCFGDMGGGRSVRYGASTDQAAR
jgi:hypothetical protein